jgi:hypothetical protein
MSLVAILAQLRARYTVNSNVPARQVLKSGLGVQAMAGGAWLLMRDKVKPGNKEVEVIARDAKISSGFSVATSQGRTSSTVYRLITPLEDAPEIATLELCPNCEERSLIDTVHDGFGKICPRCEELNTRVPAQLEPDQQGGQIAPTPASSDWRPGVPLEHPKGMKRNQVYHFFAFGVLFTASVQVHDHGNRIAWAAQSALEGPHGEYREASSSEFETWFALYSNPSPEVLRVAS